MEIKKANLNNELKKTTQKLKDVGVYPYIIDRTLKTIQVYSHINNFAEEEVARQISYFKQHLKYKQDVLNEFSLNGLPDEWIRQDISKRCNSKIIEFLTLSLDYDVEDKSYFNPSFMKLLGIEPDSELSHIPKCEINNPINWDFKHVNCDWIRQLCNRLNPKLKVA